MEVPELKVLVIGGGGTVGSAVVAVLRERHTVIPASRSSDVAVDIRDERSIIAMYQEVGTVDAVVCAAGGAPFVALPDASPADFAVGFGDKLGGQINLVLHGMDRVTDSGSFTLITGVLAREPIATGVISSTVNGGLEAFVTAARGRTAPWYQNQRGQPVGAHRITGEVRQVLPRIRQRASSRRRKRIREVRRRCPHRSHLCPQVMAHGGWPAEPAR
jgi:hypothetical protein